jgi:hypothetical protein
MMFHPMLSAHDETPHNDQQAHFCARHRPLGSANHGLASWFIGDCSTATVLTDFEYSVGGRVIPTMAGYAIELCHAFLV